MIRFTRQHMWFCLIILSIQAAAVADTGRSRFFHSGDGVLKLVDRKSGATFSGRYRLPDGTYDASAYDSICAVFGAPCTPEKPLISLRLLEFVDFLQDRFNPGATIVLTSGYRSPQYNTSIRRKGALAAKASLHQYGMAVDLMMEHIDSRAIWSYVKSIGFGGTGYYNGQTVHVDVGPARWWDQRTSGVGSGISDDNKRIGMICDFDVYPPGGRMMLRLIRMTAFPIGLHPTFELIRVHGNPSSASPLQFQPVFTAAVRGPCPQFSSIEQLNGIRWRLPQDLLPGSYRVRARFCELTTAGMPKTVTTPLFHVRKGGAQNQWMPP